MAEENDTRIDDYPSGRTEDFQLEENINLSARTIPQQVSDSSEQATSQQSTQRSLKQRTQKTMTSSRAKDNEIVKRVSDCYKKYFSDLNKDTISSEVIAALILEVPDSEQKYEVVILTAGCKYITSKCTFEKNYCWDICDGHAEAVCLRLAFVYFLSEMSKALENGHMPPSACKPASSIFTYEKSTGYHLKQNVQFHLFVSHPPCGFMTESSLPLLSWKKFNTKPHVLECSSKILICAYLGIQGPLICWLPKPIHLTSVVIMDNQNFKRRTPNTTIDVINKQFDDFKNTVADLEKHYAQSMKDYRFLMSTIKVDSTEEQYRISMIIKRYNIISKSVDETLALSEVNLTNCYKKPHIQLLATSAEENKGLFIENKLLCNDPKDNVPCYFAIPGTPTSTEGHCFSWEKDKDSIFLRRDISIEVKECYSKLRTMPSSTQNNQENFRNTLKLLEKALPIQDSVKALQKNLCSGFISDKNLFTEYVAKLFPIDVVMQFKSDFSEDTLKQFNKKNIDITQTFFQYCSKYVEADKGKQKMLKPQISHVAVTFKEFVAKLETFFILRRLEDKHCEDSSFRTLADIDCDWHRHLEMMKRVSRYFVHEQTEQPMGNT